MSTKIVIVAIVALLGAAVAYQSFNKPTKPAKVVNLDPPVGANMLPKDVSALMMMSDVAAAKKQKRDAVAAQYVDFRISDPGWEGPVEAAEKSSGGVTASMYMVTNGIMGGGYYIIATFPGEIREIGKDDVLRFTGRIDRFECIAPSSINPLPMNRIYVDHGKLLDHRKR